MNVTHLQSFLGSVGYYQHFIPNFNLIARPLREMLKDRMSKRTPVLLTSETEVVFVKLREMLAGHPVLLLIESELPYVLQSDALDEWH